MKHFILIFLSIVSILMGFLTIIIMSSVVSIVLEISETWSCIVTVLWYVLMHIIGKSTEYMAGLIRKEMNSDTV